MFTLRMENNTKQQQILLTAIKLRQVDYCQCLKLRNATSSLIIIFLFLPNTVESFTYIPQ
jgi:hypothetical protein